MSSNGAQFSNAELERLMQLAHALADRAGAAIRPHFRSALDIEDKGVGQRFDPVTVADRAAEAAIVGLLAAEQPDHRILGEELGNGGGEGPLTWVVDPIDGTRAFILGLPTWGTLIGLSDGQAPVLGVMDQPYTRERFWGDRRGAFLRDAAGRVHGLRTRPCRSLKEAQFATTSPDMFEAGEETEAYERVRRAVRATRYGTDCYAYCLLAAGLVDVVVEAGLKPYDIAALIPIIEAAGGRVTDWTGGSAANGGRVIAVGDPAILEDALAVLAG